MACSWKVEACAPPWPGGHQRFALGEQAARKAAEALAEENSIRNDAFCFPSEQLAGTAPFR